MTAGESVVRVPPKLMAGARRSSREPGLPVARLRWHLHELTRVTSRPRSLDRQHLLDALEARLGDMAGTVARIAADLVAPIRS